MYYRSPDGNFCGTCSINLLSSFGLDQHLKKYSLQLLLVGASDQDGMHPIDEADHFGPDHALSSCISKVHGSPALLITLEASIKHHAELKKEAFVSLYSSIPVGLEVRHQDNPDAIWRSTARNVRFLLLRCWNEKPYSQCSKAKDELSSSVPFLVSPELPSPTRYPSRNCKPLVHS